MNSYITKYNREQQIINKINEKLTEPVPDLTGQDVLVKSFQKARNKTGQ